MQPKDLVVAACGGRRRPPPAAVRVACLVLCLLCLAGAAGLSAVGCKGRPSPAAEPLRPPMAPETQYPLQPGQVVPDFTLPDLSDMQVSLGQILARTRRGVLVSFVSPGYMPCRDDLVDLAGAYRKYRAAGVEFVAVFLCDSPRPVADLAGQMHLPMPVLCDVGFRVAHSLGVEYTPVHMLLTPDGTVFLCYSGRSTDPRTGSNRLFVALDWFVWKTGQK